MSRVIKLTSSIGAASLILSGAAFAGPPTAFDAWSVTGGTIAITATGGTSADANTCPAGFTCAAATTGAGFFQREITEDSSGDSYFQTVITDETASVGAGTLDDLAFADESYVSRSGSVGLADKQRMSEVAGTEGFTTSSLINSGWAGNDVSINQGVVDTAGDGFRTDFFFEQVTDPVSGAPTGMRMKVSGNVGLTGTDKQEFVLVQQNGVLNPNAGSVSLTGVNGGTVTWVAEDDIKAIWVGQDMTVDGTPQAFGYTSYDLDPDIAGNKISAFDLVSSAAEAWDTTGVWGANSLKTDGNGF